MEIYHTIKSNYKGKQNINDILDIFKDNDKLFNNEIFDGKILDKDVNEFRIIIGYMKNYYNGILDLLLRLTYINTDNEILDLIININMDKKIDNKFAIIYTELEYDKLLNHEIFFYNNNCETKNVEMDEIKTSIKKLELSMKNMKINEFKLDAIFLNFENIRKTRQYNNNNTVFQIIKNNNLDDFYKNINEKELIRLLEEFNISFDDFWDKCRECDLSIKLLSRILSKKSSRQGSKDELKQIDICNFIAKKCGVKITYLSNVAFRPTKEGKIYSNDEIKKLKIKKDDCLKSFDASISGKFQGYITAKVVYGNGGHQDNVFIEMYQVAEWWLKYKKDDVKELEYLIILVDTNLTEKFNTIKNKYKKIKNIKVFNHYEFQKYLINVYSSSERI